MNDLITKILPAINIRYAFLAVLAMVAIDQTCISLWNIDIPTMVTASINRMFGTAITVPIISFGFAGLISMAIAHIVDLCNGTTRDVVYAPTPQPPVPDDKKVPLNG